jgi:hypothetical protein
VNGQNGHSPAINGLANPPENTLEDTQANTTSGEPHIEAPEPRRPRFSLLSAGVIPAALQNTLNGVSLPKPARRRKKLPAEQATGDWRVRNAAAIAKLADETAQRSFDPIDSLEITALLESTGVTDDVAVQYYQAPNAFALGEAVLEQMKRDGLPARPLDRLPPLFVSPLETLQDYLKGPLALVPPLMLLLIIATFSRLGQWNGAQLLLLSLGMTSSILVSNGFVQAISRRTALYLGMRKPEMAARFVRLSTSVSAGGIVSIAVLTFFLTVPFEPSRVSDASIFLFSFVGVSLIWLMAGPLSLLQRSAWLGIALVSGWIAGVLAASLASAYTPFYLVLGTSTGFVVTMAVIIFALYTGFGRQNRAGTSRMQLPSVGYMVTEATPYWTYGSLYMIFILTPHLIGWYGSLPDGQSRSVAFTTMEVGLTFSLAPLVLGYGLAEHALRLFWRQALVFQALTPGEDALAFGESLRDFCGRQRRRYQVVVALFTLACYVVFKLSLSFGVADHWLHNVALEQLTFVFYAGLCAYAMVGVGIFNAMFAVTLGQPQTAFIVLLVAFAVLVVVSVPLTVFGYAYSTVGFIAGAFILNLLSRWMTDRVLLSADFCFASVL